MRNKKLIRAIAIILAVLLVGGVVFSALFSALAEEQTEVGASPRNRIALSMEYLEDGQALHITQRLIYVNPSGRHLEGVVFYAAGNMFRRQSALMYDEGDLPSVFFDGYTPAGIDLRGVSVDGKPTDFGFQDENELYLRAACDLAPGQTCEFEFDYYLLLMRCGAFQGAGDTEFRPQQAAALHPVAALRRCGLYRRADPARELAAGRHGGDRAARERRRRLPVAGGGPGGPGLRPLLRHALARL